MSFNDLREIHPGFETTYLTQVHSDVVHAVENPPAAGLGGDALMTSIRNIILIIKTADCLPILLVDKKNRAVAAVHCGWRGTAQRLLQKVLRKMQAIYGSDMSSLLAAMGPCIGADCYEVGKEVREQFQGDSEAFRPHPAQAGKYLLDLQLANLVQMQKLGMKKENIFCVPECTLCGADFYSHRGNRQNQQRMLSFIGLSF